MLIVSETLRLNTVDYYVHIAIPTNGVERKRTIESLRLNDVNYYAKNAMTALRAER